MRKPCLGSAWLNPHKEVRVAFDHDTRKVVSKNVKGNNINVMHIIQAVGSNCRDKRTHDTKEMSKGQSMFDYEKSEQKDAFANSLKEAEKNSFKTIALPFLGGGLFLCKNDDASVAAIEGVMDYLKNKPNTILKEVHILLFDPNDEKDEQSKYKNFVVALDNWIQDNQDVTAIKTKL